MAEAIRMPLLSDTMKEGKIVAWHKKVGDTVKSDDVIAEVETDKATMEVMPYADGTLLYIGTPEGQAAKVNDIIAIVGKQGENYDALLKEGSTATGTEETGKDAQPAANGGGIATPQQPQAVAQPQQQPAQQPAAAPKPGDATVVRMPLLSDTMKEGKIVAWHKKVGDTIKSDDVIAEVETDKATMEVMPYADGTLLYIGVKEGEAAKINDIIAIVGKPGTDVAPYLNEGSGNGGNAAPQQQQSQQPAANNGAAQQQATSAQQQPQATATKDNSSDDRVKASPLAKRIAEEKGIDLHQVKGTGDNGRIIKRDVDEYKPAAAQPAQAQAGGAAKAQPATTQLQFTQGEDRSIPLSQMRKVIAQRLSESMYSAPHFYLHSTITMDKAMEARKVMNEASPVKISFNDLIIKACAMALRQHPEVNSSWMGDSIRINGNINIGSAIAIEEGLIVPVVKNADQKTLSQISAEAASLYDKARTKKLQPQEFSGNTFTISNLGMMDIDEFTAIINPPDSCILAVGKIVPTPVVEDGQIVVRQLLKLTMSCDHRVVDGAVGAKFLQTLKAYLQNPVTMLV